MNAKENGFCPNCEKYYLVGKTCPACKTKLEFEEEKREENPYIAELEMQRKELKSKHDSTYVATVILAVLAIIALFLSTGWLILICLCGLPFVIARHSYKTKINELTLKLKKEGWDEET